MSFKIIGFFLCRHTVALWPSNEYFVSSIPQNKASPSSSSSHVPPPPALGALTIQVDDDEISKHCSNFDAKGLKNLLNHRGPRRLDNFDFHLIFHLIRPILRSLEAQMQQFFNTLNRLGIHFTDKHEREFKFWESADGYRFHGFVGGLVPKGHPTYYHNRDGFPLFFFTLVYTWGNDQGDLLGLFEIRTATFQDDQSGNDFRNMMLTCTVDRVAPFPL